MDATPPPSWYPDPQRDGTLRWWDGSRWTEHVQPGRAPGKPVLGQEVTAGLGRVTFYGPDEPITHAFAPLTDQRYAGSPLAEALTRHVRAGRAGGDVQIPAVEHAAVEALTQLRARGGVLGAVAAVGEELIVETFVAPPGRMQGSGIGPTAPGMSSSAGRAGYRVVGSTARGVLGAIALWKLLVAFGFGAVLVGGGVVLAIVLPPAFPVALVLVAMGALVLGLTVWDAVRRRRPTPW